MTKLYKAANELTDENEANKVYEKIIDELKVIELKNYDQYNDAVHNLNKAEFYLQRNYPGIHDNLIKQLSIIQRKKSKLNKERKIRKQKHKGNGQGNHNGQGQVNINGQGQVNINSQGQGGRNGNILENIHEYDFTIDTMDELLFGEYEQETNFFTAQPIITDRQNVHDSSVNTKIMQDYKIIKDHHMEFSHDEFYEDMGRFSDKSKLFQIIETSEKIKQRNGTVGNIQDTEFNVLVNCYLKMKEIGGDMTILFDNIYNCSSEYFVCPTGVVANLISSFAFLMDNVGVMKTTQIIRSEIFQKVSILDDPTKKQVEGIVLEYKNDLSEHDFNRILEECYIGAGLI